MSARLAACAAVMALATGCAQLRLGEPVPAIENIARARASGIAPVAVGRFALAPGRGASQDLSLMVRTNTIYSPYGDSLARYLQEHLTAELRAAGLLDAASPVVIEGWLTDNQLYAPTGQASGSLAARFVVKRAGQVVYDRELKTRSTWDSAFMGVEAVPAAMNQYTQMHRVLVGQLLDDPTFREAARPR